MKQPESVYHEYPLTPISKILSPFQVSRQNEVSRFNWHLNSKRLVTTKNEILSTSKPNKHGRKGSNVLDNFCSWPMAGNLQSLIFTDQMVNKRRRLKKRVKTSLAFTFLHKTQPGQKAAGNFPNFF